MANSIVTAADAHALLTYDPETGLLFWKERQKGRGWNRTKIHDFAGSISDQGYVILNIGGRLYRAHRLAWLMTYGEWPPATVDHINRIRSDNRLFNLRLATRGENQRNLSIRVDNKSGHKGVFWHSEMNKWWAYINTNGKRKSLGFFTDKDEAVAVRKRAEHDVHGIFTPIAANA